jgi:hypothetical protein
VPYVPCSTVLKFKFEASQEVIEVAINEGIAYCVSIRFLVMIRDWLPPKILICISIIITPKLYMFDLMETKPWIIFGCHISHF